MDGLPFIGLHVLEGKVKFSLLFTHLFICIYMCVQKLARSNTVLPMLLCCLFVSTSYFLSIAEVKRIEMDGEHK